jgi:alkylation response protein AidB-like acyl-CoA dehydrogenase
MRLLPDEDALAFAAEVGDLLDKACDTATLRAAWDSESGRVPGLWRRLADMGVPGLVVPEQYDGAGLDLTGALPVLVEAGRAALPEPLAPTLAAASALAEAPGKVGGEVGGEVRGEVAAAWLPRMAAGEISFAVVDGSSPAPGAQWADAFLCLDAGTVTVVPRDAAVVAASPALDRGLGAATVTVHGDASPTDADAGQVRDWMYVAAAAELVGVAHAMLDLAVDYAKVREQFGKPIGSFQAVKHQLADAFVEIAFAEPVVHRGAWSVVRRLDTRLRDASHAKYAASRAATLVARTALQVHGGIGYTYEHDLHMWLKRTWSLTSMWGTSDWHKERVRSSLL